MSKIIQQYDFRYTLGRFASNIAMRLYHRKIWIEGIENLPKEKPVVFAPNHQNALIDALALIYAVPGQPVFLARADIFKKRLLAWFFRGLKILPVYRIRDGKENLANNNHVFEEAKGVLVDHKLLALFPEAVHNPIRRLLPLKKGIPRIVFLTEEEHHFTLGTVVIPVGLYYSHTDRFDETLHIQFGKPIAIEQFKTRYQENPQRAHLALRDAMTQGLRPLMIDIRDKAHYEMYELLRYLYNRPMRDRLQLKGNKQPDRFKADKAIIQMIETQTLKDASLLEQLNEKSQRILSILSTHGIEPAKFYPSIRKITAPLRVLTGALLFPFFLYGVVNHLFPILLGLFLTRKMKGSQFLSSLKFAIGLLITPLFYLIQFFLVHALIDHWLWATLYLLSLPISFILFKHIRRFYKTSQEQRKTHQMRRRDPAHWKEIMILSDELKRLLNAMPITQ